MIGLAAVVAGAVVCAIGFADLFVVVLQYAGFGLVTKRLYRGTWIVSRWTADRLPRRAGDALRSFTAPSLVLLSIAGWVGLQVLGFALIYFPAVRGTGITHDGLPPSFLTALYVSTSTISSLSFNDVTPHGLLWHLVCAWETLVGLGVLTLSITYVLNVYGVLKDQAALGSAVHHQADDTAAPRTLLRPHFHHGEARQLSHHLLELHRGLVNQYEGMRRYPILYYFTGRRPYQTMPFVLHMIGGVIGALRWGLPPDHPAANDPWLEALESGYHDTAQRIGTDFFHGAAPPEHADTDAERDHPDRRAEFDDLRRSLEEMAGLTPAAGAVDVERRYAEWLRFMTWSDTFVTAYAEDLGLDLRELVDERVSTSP